MAQGLTIAVAAKLHENQLERHLELFQRMDEVERIVLIRRGTLGERLTKLEQRPFSSGPWPIEMGRLGKGLDRLLREERVDWVVGFNPVPWGSVAWGVAAKRGVPCCLSLIGMDFLQVQRVWGAPFLAAVRRADRVTVTGESMAARLVELGVARERLFVLPHSVDLARFRPESEPSRRDIVAVGQLIRRKRMDILIEALAILRRRGHARRLTILGKGPLEPELKQHARDWGVEDAVEFVGYVDDVERFVAGARVFSLASEWEGVPFALMEAMACGLVPVVTDVGTIADWVDHRRNGLVVARRAEAFADGWEAVLGRDGTTYREQLLAERPRLGLDAGVEAWRGILEPGLVVDA